MTISLLIHADKLDQTRLKAYGDWRNETRALPDSESSYKTPCLAERAAAKVGSRNPILVEERVLEPTVFLLK